LLPGITFVAGSVSNSAVTASFDGDTRVITFTHEDGFSGDAVTFSYKTRVNANDAYWVDDFLKIFNVGNVDVNNTAVLKQDGIAGVEAKAKQTITNAFLRKSHTRTGENITYKVEINPFGKDIFGSMGRTLTDSLGAGLNIDPTSIKLYEASKPAGSAPLVQGAQVIGYSGGAYDGNVSFTQRAGGGFSSFSVDLPRNSQPYILEYTCAIDTTRAGPFTNSVGFDDGVGQDTVATDTVANTGGGTGMMGSVARLDLTKIDEVRKKGIEGVGFSVYQTVNGFEYLIMSGTTNASGVVNFFPLRLNTEYTIVETTPAEGFDGPNSLKVGAASTGLTAVKTLNKVISGTTREAFTVTVDTVGIRTLTVTNAPALVSFDFTKISSRDGLGNPLSGAEFLLEEISPITGINGSTFTPITVTSDATGLVSFSNIPFGEYKLTETEAPEHHYAPNPVITVKIDATGKVVEFGADKNSSGTGLQVLNIFSDINLEITSYNTTKSSTNLLPGVVFELQRDTGAGWVSAGTRTTDSSGFVEFKHLYENTNYRVIAVSPDGFYDTSSIYSFRTGLKLDDVYYLDWIFHSQMGSITFTKKDAGTDSILEGIWFDLYRTSGDTKTLVDSQASNASGVVTFSSILLTGNFSAADTLVSTVPSDRPTMDNTYTIDEGFVIEERWVAGYFPTEPKVLKLTSSAPNFAHFEWFNFPAEGKITLEVLDSETLLPLGGVTFGLFAPYDSLLNGRDRSEPLMTGTSCPDRFIVFEGLPLGTSAPATFESPPTLNGSGGEIVFYKYQLQDRDNYSSTYLDDPIRTTLSEDKPEAEAEAELDPEHPGTSWTSSRPRNPSAPSDPSDPSNPSNPDHYRRAALPRTGIESIMAVLVIGLIVSLIATTGVIIMIRRQSPKKEQKQGK